MPEPQVNVPAVGKVDRKWVIGGMAAVAGIVVYAYWRNARAPVDDEAPVEGDQYAPGDQWSPDAYIGANAPGGETYDPNAVTENVPGTNAEWSQRVIDALESVGYDRNKAATTVGKYLSGQPLDTTERLIIQTAIALLGNPPAGALPLIPAPGTPTTTPPGTTPPGTPAAKLPRPTLHVGAGNPRNTIYQLSCNKVPGAAGYLWRRAAGPGGISLFWTPGPARKTPPLRRGARYSYQVRATPAPGSGKTQSDWSNTVTFTVPKR